MLGKPAKKRAIGQRVVAIVGAAILCLAAGLADAPKSWSGEPYPTAHRISSTAMPPSSFEVENFPHGEESEFSLPGLQTALACRAAVAPFSRPRRNDRHLIDVDLTGPRQNSFADTVKRWNNDIFWAPASASNSVVTRFGDEERAGIGPIPDGDCSDGVARILPLQVEGNTVVLKPNQEKVESQLEFEHPDAAGAHVQWPASIPHVDNPRLA